MEALHRVQELHEGGHHHRDPVVQKVVGDAGGRKGLSGPHPAVEQEALVLFKHLIKMLRKTEAELQVPGVVLSLLEVVEGGAPQALIHEALFLQGFDGLEFLLLLFPELQAALLLSPAPARYRDLFPDLCVWVKRDPFQIRHINFDLPACVAVSTHEEAIFVVVVALFRFVGGFSTLDDGLHNPRHIIHLHHPTLHTGYYPVTEETRFRPYFFS